MMRELCGVFVDQPVRVCVCVCVCGWFDIIEKICCCFRCCYCHLFSKLCILHIWQGRGTFS